MTQTLRDGTLGPVPNRAGLLCVPILWPRTQLLCMHNFGYGQGGPHEYALRIHREHS
jgi:hypothetical protein